MKDKVAVITGSTSGIGLEIAKHFAKLESKIVINGFAKEDEVAKILAELKELGASSVFYQGINLAEPEEIRSMFERIIKEFGKIDILVNNAGIQHVAPIDEFPEDKWEQILRIDLIASFYTTKYAIPIMKKNGFGRIVNIASAHAYVASPFKSAYVAAKHGILGLTKTVALEVAENNITVNAICPGYVNTPLVQNQIADTAKARHISEESALRDVILKSQATKKFVEADEIANLVIFLCDEKASSITGSGLLIDGGWTAQ
ncbi:3-hydroxybutyrate dehydrogenase [Rickettsia hoogstraalii]|uniref:3-hydroxybutyrate dehydrogenase n=1 Tax=Rickettsia hoogstraalii TaxID=467174 RepID=UPI00058C086E|nr:3-hydroxybutyrate dehydrogenase [Rickettsia hoogstraalii]MCX4084555.1 3-hydroxybutyrate dehydrogenase [Rickettsia hoogstraalii]